MSDIIKQLESLKTDPKAGWVNVAVRDSARTKLLEAIGHCEAPVVLATVSDNSKAYVRWAFVDFVSKPIAVGAAVFVIAFGGWMGTVKAASNSLPGDALYGLKMVTERAQLKIASVEEKAVLHTEFAERRLAEVMAINKSDDPEKAAYVGQTIDAFKAQLELADDNLQILKDSGDSETVHVASVIDQKVSELSTTLGQTIEEAGKNDSEVAVQVEDAQEVAREVSDSAVDAIVDTTENTEEEPEVDMDALFKKRLNSIKSDQTFDLGRLVVISNVLVEHDDELLDLGFSESDISTLNYQITHVTDEVFDAMDLLAAGGYRAAFDIVMSIESELRDLESQIAQMEISIINAISESAQGADEEVAAEG